MLLACDAVQGESDENSGALRIPQINEEPLAHGALQGEIDTSLHPANLLQIVSLQPSRHAALSSHRFDPPGNAAT